MRKRLWGCLALVLAAAMAACSSTPDPSNENVPPTLVTRTSDATVWTTAEAEAAAKAAAAQRQASGRNAPTTAPARPAAAAGAVAAAVSATIAPTAPLDAGPPARLIYFDFDSYDIKPDFAAAIEGHARALAAAPARSMVIEGHADERGGAEYNLALGQKRAQAVVKALRLLGVADAQIEAVSFGDTRPVAKGATEEAWAQNRRAELKDR